MDSGHLHRCNQLYALTLKDYHSANERLKLCEYISASQLIQVSNNIVAGKHLTRQQEETSDSIE